MSLLPFFIRLISSSPRSAPSADSLVPFVTDSADPLMRDLRVATLDQLAGVIGGGGGGSTPRNLDLTPRKPLLLSGTGINGLIPYGQSLGVGALGTPIISTSQPYNNLTFVGGVKSSSTADKASFAPLVEDTKGENGSTGGNRGETICSGAANYAVRTAAIQAGVLPSEFTIFASAPGNGGTEIAGLKKGTAPYNRLLGQVSSAATLAAAAGRAFAVHAVPFLQGESDATDGTPGPVWTAEMVQLTDDLNTDIKSITGQTTPVYVLLYQTASQARTTDGRIALAQLEAVRQHELIHFAGPISHMPYSDGVHLTNVGYNWFGAYNGRSFYQLVVEGRAPDCVWPVSATVEGTTLRVRFRAPSAITIDTTTLRPTTDNGFKVQDDSGTLTLFDQQIIDGDTWQATINRPLSANAVVRYGIDYLASGLNISGGASGNLRDTTKDTVSILGVERPLWHVAPAFSLPIVQLA
jgi:Carbohydrate esterase, sialic acid-specific acetylesterase